MDRLCVTLNLPLMNGDNWPLITDEPVEIHDFMKTTNP